MLLPSAAFTRPPYLCPFSLLVSPTYGGKDSTLEYTIYYYRNALYEILGILTMFARLSPQLITPGKGDRRGEKGGERSSTNE